MFELRLSTYFETQASAFGLSNICDGYRQRDTWLSPPVWFYMVGQELRCSGLWLASQIPMLIHPTGSALRLDTLLACRLLA